MKRLIALAKKKPRWLPNEGYWRILQILRMAALVPPALIGVALLATIDVDSGKIISPLGAGLFFLALGVAAFMAVHGIAWMLVWVIEGFSDSKKS
jgi:ABC-type sulfate transport system permease component